MLVEAAEFDPISIRTTARRLNLHSDSSYRFERPLDPEGIDWASRRCCELILELAGGELAAGVVDVGRRPPPRPPIVLRFSAAQTHPRHRRGAGAGAANPHGPGQRRDAADRRRRATAGHLDHRRAAQLAPRPVAGDRPGRGSRPDPRLREDSRRRGRAHGPLGPQPRRPRAGEGPPGAGRGRASTRR